MYTLEELQDKTFKELKQIGWHFNALPAGDRRCRQNWIDAIAGVNSPLLELLEVSPGVKVEPIEEPIESLPEALECPGCGAIHSLFTDSDYLKMLNRKVIRCLHCNYVRPKNYLGPIQSEAAEPIEIQPQEPPLESKFGRIAYPKVSVKPIAQAAKTSPGVESFTEADCPPNRGDNGRDRLESAIGNNFSVVEAAIGNNFPVGVTFSSRFLAAYLPPQAEIIHFKSDADGQLSLFDFEVESVDEPPDPDDFDSMFAFWAAYDAWDEVHPDDDDSEHYGFSSEHNEPLFVLLTSSASMCQWAPCPDEWYWPPAIEPPSMAELSPTESSDTCNFSIPIFGAAGDRTNGNEEPPTFGVGARLPKPKPPSFPPMCVVVGDRLLAQFIWIGET